MHVKNSPEFLTHKQNLETIYSTGNSINGPITSAIDINSCPGNEFIAMASANGELRAKVVIVKLAYSAYVKLIFSDNNKSIIVFTMKNMINGMNIVTIEFKFSNRSSPWLAKIQNTARDKNQICKSVINSVAFSFKLSFSINFVIWAATNGIMMTITREYASCE